MSITPHRPLAAAGILAALFLSSSAWLAGCEKKSDAPSTTGRRDDHGHGGDRGDGDDHAHGDSRDHDHGHGDDHDHSHGPETSLGEQAVDGVTITASRSGDVAPGGDAPVLVRIGGASGGVSAVRIWIGFRDGRGSVKARAALDDGRWHAHAEVPDPLPAESRLWIEVELAPGRKVVAGFDLDPSTP